MQSGEGAIAHDIQNRYRKLYKNIKQSKEV